MTTVYAREDYLGADEYIDIVRKSLTALVRQIAQNAGHDGAVVSGKLLDQKNATFGFDAQKDEYCDLVKAGVIDPAKVTRSALQNAASISALMLTTEAMICEIPEKKSPGHAHGNPQMDMDM